MKWYAIYTYSGQENTTRTNIINRLKALKGEDKVGQIIVPTEKTREIREGKRRIITRKVFPGYILIQMELDENIWHIIRYTPGVFGFVGTRTRPVPLKDEEVKEILGRIEEAEDKAKPKVVFKKGESVRVIEGPFTDFMGVVRDIDLKRERLHIMVNILGRQTPLELEFYQVERL